MARPIRIVDGVGYVELGADAGFAMIDAGDAADMGRFSWHKKVAESGGFYARAHVPGNRGARVYLHRYLLAPPPGIDVDHIDGDGLNCRRANLRLADKKANARNRKANRAKVLPKGVYLARDGYYHAEIRSGEHQYRLGTYLTGEEAGAAYAGASRILHGRFALAARDDVIVTQEDVCYSDGMGSSVRSIRLSDDLWARIIAEAQEQNVSVNMLVTRAIEGNLTGPEKAGPVAQRTERPASDRVVVGSNPTGVAKLEASGDVFRASDLVSFGGPRRPPGSMLKRDKKDR